MSIVTCSIAPEAGKKGRTFQGHLLGYATADSLWSGGGVGNGIRPVFVAWACSHGEVGPFMANLRLGRVVTMVDHRGYRRKKGPFIELLRSAGYVFHLQKFAEGVVVTAYLESLFVVDPGMIDPIGGINFVILPPGAPVEGEPAPGGPSAKDTAIIKGLAPTFAAFVDRRTRAPLIPDPRFYEALLTACLDNGLASFSALQWGCGWGRGRHGFEEHNLEAIGMGDGVAMHATHEAFERVLAEVVRDF